MATFSGSADMLEERCALDRLTHDDSLGKRDASQGAELRVAALDQRPEGWRGQPSGDRVAGVGRVR
jgi:hypothetical protein